MDIMAERVARPVRASRDGSPGINVRLGAKALVTAGDSVLLVREYHADGTAFWTLPGGGVRPNESVVGALERELAEELRCRCVVGDRTTSFWYAHSSRPETVSVYDVHECSLTTRPVAAESAGVTELRWVTPDSIPGSTLPQVRRVVENAHW